MRHRVYGKHLGRDKNQRKALLRSLLSSLLTYGTIQTTEAKAKAVKGLVDKVINLAKNEAKASPTNKQSGSLLRSFLTDKKLKDRLVADIAPKLTGRTSGYTSVVRVGPRVGDNATIVRMSLIGMEKLEPPKKEETLKPKKEQPKRAVKKATTAKKPVKKVGGPKKV